MSGDDLRATCCPDLWDRINELENERDTLIKAAYVLGHKHAALPLGDREVLFTDDPVLAEILDLEYEDAESIEN